jgi:hypothetical protein
MPLTDAEKLRKIEELTVINSINAEGDYNDFCLSLFEILDISDERNAEIMKKFVEENGR